jgi:hypothetical protein
MGLTYLFPAAFIVAGLSPPADLSQLDRTVPDEPAYQTRAPKYCLLAFGPGARSTAWLVHDGRAVHLHASPDGKAAKVWRRVTSDSGTFDLGDVWAGAKLYTNLRFSPKSDYQLSVRIDGRRQLAGRDRTGCLELAATAKGAPVVHFDGPLTLDLYSEQEPLRTETESELRVVVGTRGIGTGTFAHALCNAFPKGAWPTALINYPSGASARVRLHDG